MRCRPEAAPGTPAWRGAAATVSRALKLIDRGFLDEKSVDELADTLGVGGRHLRRLFLKHAGASPLAAASTRRVQRAKTLLDPAGNPVFVNAALVSPYVVNVFSKTFYTR